MFYYYYFFLGGGITLNLVCISILISTIARIIEYSRVEVFKVINWEITHNILETVENTDIRRWAQKGAAFVCNVVKNQR